MELRFHNEVSIPTGNKILKGELLIPLDAKSIIVFSHGSGSSRFSRRNREVAKYLNENNLGSLLFDLLTEEEDQLYNNRFNIDLLTKRLAGATEWLEKFPAANNCRIGYFGASTGAASALKAAAMLPQIKAVVSRGGRPDLALDVLHKVTAPTLLIVGSLDHDVLLLNRKAYQHLECEKRLEIVEGAAHLFEEPGKMEMVSGLACNWFQKYLQPSPIKIS
jgi:pimeloyl-ACP methyl ester carboxylesterase